MPPDRPVVTQQTLLSLCLSVYTLLMAAVDMPIEDTQSLLELNLLSAIHMTTLVLPDMLQRGTGKVRGAVHFCTYHVYRSTSCTVLFPVSCFLFVSVGY